MKIGDLWVKLGLKKDDFDRGMKDAGDKVSGSGGLAGKIKGLKAIATNAWLEIAKGAIQMADVFAHTSQRMGDAWDRAVSGMKASIRALFDAVNSMDFSNLGKRLADAFKNGSELASMKDAEFEVMNSIALQKAAMKDELAVLEIRMRNQRLSQKERQEAAQEYLNKVKGIYEQEAEYRKKYARLQQEVFLENAGVAKSKKNFGYVQSFLTDIAPKSGLVEALDNFKKNGYSYSDEAQRKLLEGLKEQTGMNLRTLAQIANYYQSSNDAASKELVNAIVAAKEAEGAFNEETRRVQNIANGNGSYGGGGGGNSQQNAANAILARAEKSAKSTLQILTETYQQEKALLESFGMDTTALSAEFSKNIKNILDVPLDKMQELDDLVVDVDVEIDDSTVDDFVNKYEEDIKRMQDLLAEFRDAGIKGFSDAAQELADQFMGLSEINPGKIVEALLTPLADMAIKEGEILIAQGIGVEACKKALESLQGVAAIAAGASLVMIGAAAKAGLKSLGASAGKSTAGSASASSSGTAASNVETRSEITIFVSGRVDGSDIVLAGERTLNKWNR